MKKNSLVPLKIPTGWIVHHNCFFDEPLLLEDGSENKSHNDSEDILWIERLDFQELGRYVIQILKHNQRLNAEELEITKELWEEARLKTANSLHYHIDLGWYGNRKEGHYRLVVHCGWDNIIGSFQSREISEIQKKIDYVLHQYSCNGRIREEDFATK